MTKQHNMLVRTLLAFVLAACFAFTACGGGTQGASQSGGTIAPSGADASAVSASGEALPNQSWPAPNLPQEMRAMWISFLEWDKYDISTEEKLRTVAGEMFQNCADIGLNTVIVHVRAFGDAFYPSALFPWSHQITGTQGQDPGFDPLAVMIEEAHARGLRIEGFINPYRAKHGMHADVELAANHPAALHPEWVRDVNGTLWFDPGIPEVEEMVVEGVRELAAYPLDGIQMDDYFYQTGISEEFDADTYAQYGGGLPLANWRRENVNRLVRNVYTAVKQTNPTMPFGISPAGNNDNNYNQYYADVALWMSEPGYIDYVMPQLYWGFNHQLSSGSTKFAFPNITQEWAAYPRREGLALYAGLAAYAIHDGDGSSADQSEWQTGDILARMAEHLRTVPGFSGFALFRYDYLFAMQEPSPQEAQALKNLLLA